MTHVPNILVVDDEIGVLQSMRFALDRDFAVVTARSVAGAFEILRSQSIDLVILDVTLPDGDGIAALDRIRTEWPALPVLMLSARDGRRSSAEIAGANGWLTKPPDLHELRTAIRSLVNQP